MAADYRKIIVQTAQKYIGTTEPNGDDQFIAAYNKTVGTGFAMNVAWCAMFVTFCARMSGVPTTVIPNFASCSVSLNSFFIPKGRFHKRTTGYVPQPGDLIYYDWNGNGQPQHVGLVASVSGGKVNTIEGNTSDSTKKVKQDGVFTKSRALSYSCILGYAEPDYSCISSGTGISNQTQLSSMVKGTYVKRLQEWLNATYKSGLTVDGIFGANSKKAAIKAWQSQMNSSNKSKLAVDGAFGPLCRAAANKHCVTQKSKGNLVKLLQGLLYAHGYDPKGFDGTFGANTLSAVKAFQKARKLAVDGEVGANTWESLLTKW